ncbi:bifunctional phosphopantothenoylcysteine decarboxylase/phosphopantothenate--cysteine ligase CoaBC [Thermodesulfobacteriota bacterium]
MLKNKTIVVGVTGGIAAYKSVELVRLLAKEEAKVRVVMTRNAQYFVGPLTFRVLSGEPVFTDMFETHGDVSIWHISWAEEAEAVIIAPATANIIGKLAHGIADDPLSTMMLAVEAPVMICPSMNTHMYENEIVQRNLERLSERGFHVVSPGSGPLACGATGPGRLPEPPVIVDRLLRILRPQDFAGFRVLVTAGPTQEPIDPVRYISNPSTGMMGFAIARAAEHRGAEVILVSGPSPLPDPLNVEVVRVRTAREMAEAVYERTEHSRVIIKTAAVADYRPEKFEDQKIKKAQGPNTLSLALNPDILKELGRRKKPGQVLVGFAAETQELSRNAQQKLDEKNLDMIVANLIGSPGSGFGTQTNKVSFFFHDGTRETLPLLSKDAVAHALLDRVKGVCGQSTPDD